MKTKNWNNFWNQVALRADLNQDDIRIQEIAEFSFGRGYSSGYTKGYFFGFLVTAASIASAYLWYKVGKEEAELKYEEKMNEASESLKKIAKKYSKSKIEDEDVNKAWKDHIQNSKKAKITKPEKVEEVKDENQQE